VKRINWLTAIALIGGAALWLELFLRWPLEAVVALAAVGGWWDYQRRRSKLKPR
jgi:Mn2+/Fe2+ NRAMP family transporter